MVRIQVTHYTPDFRAIFDASPGLYLVLRPDDPAFTIVAVNQAYAQATLTNPDEIVGRGLFDVFPDNPADPRISGVSNLQASLRRVIATGAADDMPVQKYDIRRPLSEGGRFEERYWSPVTSPVFGEQGQIVCLLHRLEDVTELVRLRHMATDVKQIKLAARERQLLSALVERSPQFICVSDLNGMPVYANSQALAMTGAHDLDEIRKTPVTDYFVPEERVFVREVVLPAVREQGVWQGELHFQHLQSGESISVHYHLFRVDDEVTAKPVHFAAITRDLRENKQLEERAAFLKQLHEAMSSLMDPLAIMQTAARLLGEHLRVNRCGYAEVAADGDAVQVASDYTQGVKSMAGRWPLAQFGAEGARLLQAGQPYSVEDAETDPRTAAVLKAYRGPGIAAALWVPLLRQERLTALMQVHQTAPRAWRADEVELVRLVAKRCAELLERARVTRDLRDHQQQLRLALDTGRLGAWELHLATGALQLSPQCRANFGLAGEHSLSFPELLAMVHPEDRPRLQAAVEQAEYQIEYRLTRGDGKLGWIGASGGARQQPGGTPTMVGMTLDVTERKLAEETRRASEERLSLALGAGSVGTWDWHVEVS